MRMLELDAYEEFRDYLIESKLSTIEDFMQLNRDFEKAKFIGETLQMAAESEKLLLLDYEWKILPIEQIKITVVMPSGKKEFTHGY